ncbi:MAG: 4-aminobutyrate--2-oxoglutarate transaminase [Actinomycetota bacterium]
MSTNESIHARRIAATPRGWGSMYPIYVDKAEGSEITDVEGNRYIDFAAGIAVVNTGHLHPKVKAAAIEQLDHVSHTCFMITPYEPAVELAERLNDLAPGDTPKKTLFVNSGAEAVENAVKIARYHTGRPGVIAFSGGFHGRTFMTMSLTGKVAPYKQGFGPMPGPVFHVPFPYAYRGVSIQDSLDAIAHVFKEDMEPSQIAAIIVEPQIGEGGFIPAPPEFLQALRALADEHGIILVADEIQTGFSRTGKLFASEYSGIEPDLMTLAKSLAGGFPLAAVVGKAEIMDAPHPGGLGGTYGGNPVACAAGLAVLDVIEEEELSERANTVGGRIKERMGVLAERHSEIGEIRGLGAMVAMELVTDPETKEPNPELTKAITAAAIEKGLILLSCGVYGNVIRFLAPLTIEDDVLDEGLDIVEAVLDDLAG